MERIHIWVLSISFILLLPLSNSVDEEVKQTLLTFFQRLSNGNHSADLSFGWNSTSDPCDDRWKGISCDPRSSSIKKLVLENLGLRGTLDVRSICTIQTLGVLSVQNNFIHGELQPEIENCQQLTHLYINQNQFSGHLPDTLPGLNNLKRLFIYENSFSGELPDLPKISGLVSFLAQYNHLTGKIPKFDFSNLQGFNVSFNNFSGPIPKPTGRFDDSSFLGNPELCGKPTSKQCPNSNLPGGQQVPMLGI
ncbi:probable leucine-rich repeat receptor-like protein kinase At1g68400 [Magnolia sinica]|uniref:probable leucine-rich repeat receptor-like protein kinase At1g68400 n=1 Tax=Magnolia sinica TaxID=86752 RepID=UPI00265B4EBB|nr:probable leucine-rich repeat receptor-like protein kinase At1g68400 [Magnolia sinica]